jgi:hypothetical protein
VNATSFRQALSSIRKDFIIINVNNFVTGKQLYDLLPENWTSRNVSKSDNSVCLNVKSSKSILLKHVKGVFSREMLMIKK